ncbi:hypothetical protein B0F90DRAFT_1766125, partial [Multifurca ochricompacta]
MGPVSILIKYFIFSCSLSNIGSLYLRIHKTSHSFPLFYLGNILYLELTTEWIQSMVSV